MGRILQAISVLLLLAVLGTLGYAYFGDMNADPADQRMPVSLPGLAPPPAAAPGPAALPTALPATAPAAPAAAAAVAPAADVPAAADPAPAQPPAGAGLDD